MILREGYFETINNYDFAWTDIQKPTRDHINMLGKQYPFHELNLDDCLSKIHIPKIDKYKDHLFIILNFPVNMQEEKPEYDTPKVSQLSIFIGTNYLVTIHQSELKPLVDMFQLCKSNDKERETSMGDSPGFLLHSILDALVRDLFHRLTKIQGNLNDLEEDIFDERTKSAKAKEINLLRREIASLRRIAIQLRNRIFEITNEIQKFSKEDIISYYNDVEDHVNKIVETLEEAKETIEIYKDVYYMLGTEKANKILSILTIIFTLSIPVTVISSFYGMNIRLPGRIEAPPTFLGLYKYDLCNNTLDNSHFIDVLVFPSCRLDEFRLNLFCCTIAIVDIDRMLNVNNFRRGKLGCLLTDTKYVSSIIKCPCKCDCDQTLDVAITAFKDERKMDRYQSINMVKSKAKPKSKGKGKK